MMISCGNCGSLVSLRRPCKACRSRLHLEHGHDAHHFDTVDHTWNPGRHPDGELCQRTHNHTYDNPAHGHPPTERTRA
jgi:hypothetical protein